jgi:hypothetical protein
VRLGTQMYEDTKLGRKTEPASEGMKEEGSVYLGISHERPFGGLSASIMFGRLRGNFDGWTLITVVT